MKIEASAVTASATRVYERVEYNETRATAWGVAAAPAEEEQADELSLSEQGQQAVDQAAQKKKGGATIARIWSPSKARSTVPTDETSMKLRLLEQMIEQLTGRKYKARFHELSDRMNNLDSEPSAQALSLGDAGEGRSVRGMGFEMTRTEYLLEHESVSYSASASVRTADGREIDVNVELNMSRSFMYYAESKFTLDMQFCDPLVINYGGTAASLTSDKYSFDLDADGVMDNISFAGAGSGFLALDKNGDGVINDGTELFGPQTGKGFEELRAYDEDGNGWIDENDDVFTQLRIWSKNAEGNDQLFTLAELDVGALYLGDVETQFSVNDAENNTHGMVRSTSFYLKESGGAGTVQHVDLSV